MCYERKVIDDENPCIQRYCERQKDTKTCQGRIFLKKKVCFKLRETCQKKSLISLLNDYFVTEKNCLKFTTRQLVKDTGISKKDINEVIFKAMHNNMLKGFTF